MDEKIEFGECIQIKQDGTVTKANSGERVQQYPDATHCSITEEAVNRANKTGLPLVLVLIQMVREARGEKC